jgi:hypothetical protein
VAVDSAGAVAAGSATPTVMPFADLNTAAAAAVDSAGNV